MQELLQKGKDPSKVRLNAGSQELLAMKYSPEIIAQAEHHRTTELAYLSELLEEAPAPTTNPIRNRHPR